LTFQDFNFVSSLQEGLDTMGFTKPTPIQLEAIPVVLEGKDLIACAQTGTGKTASYLLPLLHKIEQDDNSHIDTLILSPTRELALQIDQQIMGLAYFTGCTSIAVYGGGDGFSYEQQKRSLTDGVNIVVATPGRLIAHLTSKAINLDHLKHLVLDEADRMMDMGFYEDIVRIISYLPKKRQNLLFSATMPPKIRSLAKKILHDPVEINIAISKPSAGILQQAYLVFDDEKIELLKNILANAEFKSVIVFASRKETVKKLNSALNRQGILSEAFHSDLDQDSREDIMVRFKGKKLAVLIGTDVISRGIDVEAISLVVNFDVPPDPEDYIHRIGRTARAETTGTAITFINDKDQFQFGRIEEMIGNEVPKLPLPEGLKEGPEYKPSVRFKKKFTGNSNWKKKKNFKKPNP
jgi:ATP-dependent RNA helicase RhlE